MLLGGSLGRARTVGLRGQALSAKDLPCGSEIFSSLRQKLGQRSHGGGRGPTLCLDGGASPGPHRGP